MSFLRVHDEHVNRDFCFSLSVWYLSNVDGEIEIEVCTTCGYVFARCSHTKNAWNEDGTILSCQLCGEDVT